MIIWALGGAASLVVTAILLSQSRGGSLALLASGGVLVTTYLCRGLADRRSMYGLAGLAVVVVATAVGSRIRSSRATARMISRRDH